MEIFPVINTLADVLPSIEGRDEILVADRGTHTVVNYLVVKEDTFPPLNVAGGSKKMREQRRLDNMIRRECRGMIFDRDGKILRRPLHKFFNMNEREETLPRNIDLSRPHVLLEKLDGSSIAPFPINAYRSDCRLVYGTRMGDTEIGQQAADHAAKNDGYRQFFDYCWKSDLTPIYEWCSRSQRIVIDHPEDRLVLLAARHLYSGEYATYHDLTVWGNYYDIPVVQVLGVGHNGSSDHLVEVIRSLPMAEYGEGVVVRFEDNGEMVKIKCDEYCVIHRAKERILEERYVVEDIINGNIDDIMATVLEEDRKKIERYRGEFWTALDEFIEFLMGRILLRHAKFPNRKDYALSVLQKEDSKFVTRAVFWFYDEREKHQGNLLLSDVRKFVIENRVRSALSTRVKFGEMKNEVLAGISFKY